MDISTSYLPTPFEMTAGEWTITSPVPDIEAGQLLARYVAIQAQAYEATQNGAHLDLEAMRDKFSFTDDEAMNLVLGEKQVADLRSRRCPEAIIMHATMCAIYYWAYGGSEEAVQMYLAAADAVNGEDDPKDQLRNRIRSLIGQNTESVNQSDTAKTAHPSTQNTRPRKGRKKRRRA